MIKTHRKNPKEDDGRIEHCAICDAPTLAWSQDEGIAGIWIGPVVWHCRTHRDDARRIARKLSQDFLTSGVCTFALANGAIVRWQDSDAGIIETTL